MRGMIWEAWARPWGKDSSARRVGPSERAREPIRPEVSMDNARGIGISDFLVSNLDWKPECVRRFALGAASSFGKARREAQLTTQDGRALRDQALNDRAGQGESDESGVGGKERIGEAPSPRLRMPSRALQNYHRQLRRRLSSRRDPSGAAEARTRRYH